jgi:hypothetical protein
MTEGETDSRHTTADTHDLWPAWPELAQVIRRPAQAGG